MLTQLNISNYALIDSIEIPLKSGLTIITGETGAGKSIIMGALSLLLGQRADIKSIRNAEKKTIVEASFDISGYGLDSFLESNDIDKCGDECILRREILPTGRTRAFVNDTPVTLAVLSTLALRLVDIHSQHSNALLLSDSYQLQVIDSLADNKDLRTDYEQEYAKYAQLKKELAQLKERIEKNQANEEYFKFQLNQLKPLRLKEGEQEELETLYKKLSNVSMIKEKLWDATSLLGEGSSSIISKLAKVQNSLDDLKDVLEESGVLVERLESVAIEVQDIYDTVSAEVEDLYDDPAELERIDSRLSNIYSLQQRHHVNTVEELLKIQSELQKSLSEIENSEEELDSLQQALDNLMKVLSECADKLTTSRRTAAKRFEEALLQRAMPLGMKNLRCLVEFKKADFDKSGQDKVAFLFAFNKNQQLTPVEKTASGGEMSRLMLTIKSIVAQKMQLPSIIFDEVDTGVSGDVANKIGEMMKDISKNIQVITITHLPQVAALGDNHFKVFKTDVEDTTITNVRALDVNGRIQEIAGMLSGSQIDQAAINNAKSLLKIN